jgi:membrane-associated protease RseP (regulator of RpoE activity)
MRLHAYVAPGEVGSDALLDWLETMELRAVVHDVRTDDEALAEAIALGAGRLPILRHPGGLIIGFDPEALGKLASSTEDVGSGVTVELDDEGRPMVTAVEEGSPAAAAGLRPGDVITELAGYSLFSVEQLRKVLSGGVSRRLPLRVLRGDEVLRLTVQSSGSAISPQ